MSDSIEKAEGDLRYYVWYLKRLEAGGVGSNFSMNIDEEIELVGKGVAAMAALGITEKQVWDCVREGRRGSSLYSVKKEG